MNVSIAAYSFHGLRKAGMMDAFGYLETVRYRYGLDTADIWNGMLGADELVFSEEFQVRLVEGLRERELTLVNYHADGCHVWEDTEEARERNYRNALGHLRAAARFGARTVRIDAGGKGSVWTPEQLDTIVARMREYSRFGHDHGFRVGPESHWGPELVPDNMERLARAVNHPGFGILMHIGHWEGVPAEEGDRRLAPWTAHTHVSAHIAETRLEPAMKLLLDAGYKGCWGVEHHSARNEYAEVAWQLAVVKRALESARIGPAPSP